MDGFDDQNATQPDDRFDAQRKIIRASLNEIADEAGMIMRDEGLRFPVHITVRNSGDLARDDRDNARSDGRRMVARFSHRLRSHREEDWWRQIARTGTALRGCQRGADQCGRSGSWEL